MKNKRTRAHIYKHKCMNTHIHTNTHTHTHANIHTHIHVCTQRHTDARERALACNHTHTKCSFVIGGQSLWNHLPDNVKEARSIELFKQILKTLVFSQSFEIPAFSICNSALDFRRTAIEKVVWTRHDCTTIIINHVKSC